MHFLARACCPPPDFQPHHKFEELCFRSISYPPYFPCLEWIYYISGSYQRRLWCQVVRLWGFHYHIDLNEIGSLVTLKDLKCLREIFLHMLPSREVGTINCIWSGWSSPMMNCVCDRPEMCTSSTVTHYIRLVMSWGEVQFQIRMQKTEDISKSAHYSHAPKNLSWFLNNGYRL